jgi:L-ascorbate 6-phosphate lactonase
MSSVELWWLGQSGFRLQGAAGSPTVFVDPYLTPRADRTWQAPAGPEALAAADLLLCTHEHTDHFDQPAIREAAAIPGARFTLVVPRPIVEQAIDLGVPADRVIGAVPEQQIDVGGVTIHPVRARHGVTMADAYTFGEELSNGQVRFLGYVIEVDGVRVYHAGDCIPYPGQIETLKALRPQVALLPINGRDFFRETERNLVGNMDPREAAKLAHEIGVELLIPTHWELFPHNRGFPAELIAYANDYFPELTIVTPGRGSRFTFVPNNSRAPE